MNPRVVNTLLGSAAVALFISLLVIPAVYKVRQAMARTESSNNMKQMLLGIHSYHDAFGHLPPIYDRHRSEPRDKSPLTISQPVSLHVHVLPFVEAQYVYVQFAMDGKGQVDAQVAAFQAAVDDSATDRAGVQNFAANLRIFSEKGYRTPMMTDMPPLAEIEPGRIPLTGLLGGSSNTIAVSTKFAKCGEGGSRYAAEPTSPFAAFFGQNAAHAYQHHSEPRAMYQWMPAESECLTSPLLAQSSMRQGILVGMADATVRLIPPNYADGKMNGPVLWNIWMSGRRD